MRKSRGSGDISLNNSTFLRKPCAKREKDLKTGEKRGKERKREGKKYKKEKNREKDRKKTEQSSSLPSTIRIFHPYVSGSHLQSQINFFWTPVPEPLQ